MKLLKETTTLIIEENDFETDSTLIGYSLDFILIPSNLYDRWIGSELATALIPCLKKHGLILKI